MNLGKPKLANYYEQEVGITVKKKYWQRFGELEQQFIRHGIDSKHYTQVVAILWLPWCMKNNFTYIPVNVFLGEKSIAWYISIRKQTSVDLLLEDPWKMQAEYEFALNYLEYKLDGGGLTEQDYLRNYCKQGSEWFDKYLQRSRLTANTITRLSKFGRFSTRKYCSTYDRLLEVHNARV